MVHISAFLALASLITCTSAAPPQQVFSRPNHINPLKHLAAISPFYIPNQKPTPLPPECELTRVSLLIRHSSIRGNDDEFEQTMSPFINKIANTSHSKLPTHGEWAFLRSWVSPIVEEHLEELSERGRKDAKFLGKYIRHQYESLFPSKKRKHFWAFKKDKGKPAYKVWTASSPRDIDSAKAFIKGAFPKHQSGEDGHGDGDVVQLVKVPNKAKDWDRSLTPHKACEAFEKLSSLEPANKWLAVYAPRIRTRLEPHMPDLVNDLTDQDILAMQMLCGYETIVQGHSPFCHIFTDDEWLDFEYQQDVRFFYMLGYGQPLSPYLGMPWVKSALHLLDGKDTDEGGHASVLGDDFKPLPRPQLPPNATHTQRMHPSFTHRESPGFVAVFLNLFNSTHLVHPASEPPPLDQRVTDRAWRTSHLIPFLGHIALERFHDKDGGDFVRAVVNGRHQVMSGCDDGIEGSCKWETFRRFVEDREVIYGDWASVCEKE